MYYQISIKNSLRSFFLLCFLTMSNLQPQPASTPNQTPAESTFSATIEQAAQTETSHWKLFIIAFVAGILISFTPCVYPMIPITIGIMQGNASSTLLRNFGTASTYVAGISTVYAGLGYLAATSSIIFGQWTGNPWIIGFMVLFLLYFAFSMFGFYELYTPRFLQQRGEVSTRGSLLRIFIFGMVSGTVASPCLTPGLATLLTIAAKIGNPLIGFLMLFFFSIGMGMLLIIIGTFSGALSLLPRAGLWLEESKKLMGFLLLGMCVYFAQNILPAMLVSSLYGIIITVTISYFGWRIFGWFYP